MRVLHALSEDIIAASSPAEIAELLAERLPEATRATSINLYLFNRRSKVLERVPTADDPEPMAASVDSPPEGLASAAVVCFRNRTQLNIPDVRRSPLVKVGPKTSLPRAALFMPLMVQNAKSAQPEVLGVLEVHNDRKLGYFKPEEQAAVHHLANQAAASLKLQDQNAMREQLFRSEKLAATGQLISGVASDLRAPLDNIIQLTESLAASGSEPITEDLQRLSAEANRASEIVWRLVSFARQESVPHRVNLNGLVASLARFREPEWRVLGLKHQSQISPEPAEVAGVASQIEQVCLNVLVYAEQRAAASPAKTIAVKSSVLAGRALVEIDYSPPQGSDAEPDPFAEPESADASSGPTLEVCLGILRNHGGDARMRRRPGLCKIEIELPLAPASSEPVRSTGSSGQQHRAAADPDAGGSGSLHAARAGSEPWVAGPSGGPRERRGRRRYRAAPELRCGSVGGAARPRRLDRISRSSPRLYSCICADRRQLRSAARAEFRASRRVSALAPGTGQKARGDFAGYRRPGAPGLNPGRYLAASCFNTNGRIPPLR